MADTDSTRLRQLREERVRKAESLRERGIDPYPARVGANRRGIADARLRFERWEGGGLKRQPTVRVAGRVTNLRNLGKLAFLDLSDGSGAMQVLCSRKNLGPKRWHVIDALDLGDILEARGPLIRTRTGEITVEARDLRMLTKSLRPPPEKFHGLHDQETRYRQRYLDLQVNADARETLITRSRIVAALRRFMDTRGFLEVETPILQPEAGGAAARPFKTFFNALNEERYLRVATELHLKRLIVGGIDKVYEVGRIFRNEGVSTLHNPEFTMMESYEAYADLSDVAAMVEELVAGLAKDVIGSTDIAHGDQTLHFAPPWRRLTVTDALREYAGVELGEVRDLEAMSALLNERGISLPDSGGWGKMFGVLLEHSVEPHLTQPTFLLDWPVEISPLAKRRTDDPTLVERFEAFAGTWEIANAYSELNDPIDQRARFEEQLALRAAGDEEAELIDEDFLIALEHGMPPTGGLGIGIDRLVMLLTNTASIRDVLFFPALRRRE